MACRAHCSAPLQMRGVEPSELVGQVLESKYRVEQHLGSGAMGSVFRARHVRLPRSFAIKILNPRFLSDPRLLKRFVREAELAGRLSHRNVVGVLDVGEIDGVSFLVMELATGAPLSLLMEKAPFDPGRALELVRQLCDGLHHAHHHGLIHRDLKPDNVIVEASDGEEVARIIDFGIAVLRDADGSGDRLTTGGIVLGTPHYVAPEVATGKPFDQRADLFALGVIFYEMLTGRLPFEGDGVSVVHATVFRDVPAMSTRVPGLLVDPMLEAFARRLLARNPAERPATAAAARAMVEELQRRIPPREHARTPPPDAHASETLALGSAKTLAIATLEQPPVPPSTAQPRRKRG